MSDDRMDPLMEPSRTPQDAPDLSSGSLSDAAPFATTPPPVIQSAQFGALTNSPEGGERNALDLILDVFLEATVELGRTRQSIRDILALGPGSVVELDKLAGEPADLLINGKPLARGEVVIIDENFGIRITEIRTPTERIEGLR